jgi:acyl carrier protein
MAGYPLCEVGAAMQETSDVESRIRKVLNTSLSLGLPEEELENIETLDEFFGVDSLAVLEFIVALEKEFTITIEPEQLELAVLKDLPRLACYIASRL